MSEKFDKEYEAMHGEPPKRHSPAQQTTMTVDVRLTFRSAEEALSVAAALRTAARMLPTCSTAGVLYDETADAICLCIRDQDRVARARDIGRPFRAMRPNPLDAVFNRLNGGKR